MKRVKAIYLMALISLFHFSIQAQKMEIEIDSTLSVKADIKTEYRHGDEYRDTGSWEKSLHDKAIYFDQNTRERHNIEGNYPSSVRLRAPVTFYAGSQKDAWKNLNRTGILPEGWFIDHGTTGLSNVAHTSSWTGNLITAEAFHVATLKKEKGVNSIEYKAAYERANEIIAGIRILTLASGQPGYLVRGYALGHGPTYGERYYTVGDEDDHDLWKQGAGDYSYLRYRGGPSHHNYDQVFRGLGIYYLLAADDKQKEAIREIVEDMSNWAHLNNNMIVMLENGENISTELIGGWRALDGVANPSGSSIMATTGLKIAHFITSNKKVKALYDKWVDVLQYRKFKDSDVSFMGRERLNYDDTDHLLPDLYLLNLIEEDKDLLTFYRKCVKDSWNVHKNDKLSWFNYIYQAVLGDEYADKEGSLWNLQTFPTNRILQPQMNSIRTDIEFFSGSGNKQALHPLPVYDRPSDNEYEWKNSPYSLDGWHSRIVNKLEISPYDEYVQFSVEANGNIYRSLTKGEIWQQIEELTGVKDVVMFPKHRWLIIAATDHGIYRSLNCGDKWEKCSDLVVDQLYQAEDNTNVMYAVSANGIYASNDFGVWGAGESWDKISGNTPDLPSRTFAATRSNGQFKMYMQTISGLYHKTDKDDEWYPPKQAIRGRGFSELMTFPGNPVWTKAHHNRIFSAIAIRGWAFNGNIVIVSEDEGNTWTPVVKDLDMLYKWMVHAKDGISIPTDELMRLVDKLRELQINDLIVDKNNPDTWYGMVETGVAVTHDAGKTWETSNKGLYIPRVHSIFNSRHGDNIYVGTPAGMFVSHDGCKSWNGTSLILQDVGALRAEIGGVGYLEAYWLGRYHDFINDTEANEIWWKK